MLEKENHGFKEKKKLLTNNNNKAYQDFYLERLFDCFPFQ
jgi:hypothetical protein